MKILSIFIIFFIINSYLTKKHIIRIGQLSLALFFKKLGNKSSMRRISNKLTKQCPYSIITNYWKKAFLKFQVSIFFAKKLKNNDSFTKHNKFLSFIVKIALFCSKNSFVKQRKLIKSAIKKLSKHHNYKIESFFINLANLISGKSLFKKRSIEYKNFRNLLRKSKKKLKKLSKNNYKNKRKQINFFVKSIFAKNFSNYLFNLIKLLKKN